MPLPDNNPPPSGAPSPEAVAFAQQVRKARHDLRNPLAHILGFTEMLVEKTGQQGLNFLKSRLQVIERTARELTDAVNRELDAHRLAAKDGDVAGLLANLRKFGARIEHTAESLQRKRAVRADSAFQDDLARIAGAARNLMGLAETRLAALRSAPEPDAQAHVAATARRIPERAAGRVVVSVEATDARNELQAALAESGYEIQVASDDAELRGALETGAVELVVFDVQRAVQDDLRRLRWVRERPAGKAPAILIICAPEQRTEAGRCVEAGAEDCLTLPCPPAVVRARVAGCLARKRLRDVPRRASRR